ncbi:hypothetical protein [Streptomyces sp. ID05-47C]|uniref:hypothetical protein n=1 Tax=Streptomyces sp. ID05-47C TaxID=3028665 RepID=UPI0029A413B1|nr:hypothetical protein [Streptomyces sp. ID05-47C]MDX3573634.1 hypothetical protein [Streptomyces sp. ID05-47C]
MLLGLKPEDSGRQRMAHFRAQPEELEAGPSARVGVQAEDLDGVFVAVVGEGAGEPGKQFVVGSAGCRVGHGPEGKSVELRGGQGGGVDGDGVGGQGRERLDQPLAHRRVDAPGP